MSSRGPISISTTTLSAIDNGQSGTSGYGIYAINPAALTPQPITLSGTNTLTGNYNSGLELKSNGAITLNNINASNSVQGSGADIQVHNEGFVVTLTGTNTFNGNFSNGLWISSRGLITANNITASGNSPFPNTSGYGAYMDNTAATAKVGMTLTGTNTFNDNYSGGLVLFSEGAIKLNSVTASNNRHGSGAQVSTPTDAIGLTLTGTNAFNGNYVHGLYVDFSKGPFVASSVTANDNGTSGGAYGWGVYVDNHFATLSQPVTFTGANSFSYNFSGGMYLASNGAISLSNVTANYNANGYGARINNTFAEAQAVTLSGTNSFNNNHSYGLTLLSKGVITISNLTAFSNYTSYGVDLENWSATAAPGVTLTGVNYFDVNGGDGLMIDSKGPLTIANLSAGSNTGNGADVDNTWGAGIAGVTLTGVSAFGSNTNEGLIVTSNGPIAVSTTSLTVSNNGVGTGGGVILDNDGAATPQPVTLSGITNITNSYFEGLTVSSNGAITLSNITSTGSSHGTGALITGHTNGQAVTLTGTNVFTNNHDNALNITSLGAIVLNNIKANSSTTGFGAYLDNSGASSAQAVTLTGVNQFMDNNAYGLDIFSIGQITGSNLTATNNGGFGFVVDNHTAATAGVTLTGLNDFSDNNADGVHIWSKGLVSLGKVTSDSNNGDGFDIQTLGNVTLMCGGATENTGVGIRVNTPGLVSLLGMVSAGNTSANLNLSGGGTLTQSVTCPLP